MVRTEVLVEVTGIRQAAGEPRRALRHGGTRGIEAIERQDVELSEQEGRGPPGELLDQLLGRELPPDGFRLVNPTQPQIELRQARFALLAGRDAV